MMNPMIVIYGLYSLTCVMLMFSLIYSARQVYGSRKKKKERLVPMTKEIIEGKIKLDIRDSVLKQIWEAAHAIKYFIDDDNKRSEKALIDLEELIAYYRTNFIKS